MTNIKKATLNITKDWKNDSTMNLIPNMQSKINKIQEGGVLYVEGS